MAEPPPCVCAHADGHDVGLVSTDLDSAVSGDIAGLIRGDPIVRSRGREFLGDHVGGPGVLGEHLGLEGGEEFEVARPRDAQRGVHRRAVGWP